MSEDGAFLPEPPEAPPPADAEAAPQVDQTALNRSSHRRALRRGIFWHCVLGLICFSQVGPFLWMLSTSVKPGSNIAFNKWWQHWVPGWELLTYTDPLTGKKQVVRSLPETALFDKKHEDGGRRIALVGLAALPKNKDAQLSVRYADPETGKPLPGATPFPILAGAVASYPLYQPYDPQVERDTVANKRPGKEAAPAATAATGPPIVVFNPDHVRLEWHTTIGYENYKYAWYGVRMKRGLINTIFLALVVTMGQVFTSSLAAYAFSRLNFWGRDKLFFAYLATMMVPHSVTAIPIYVLLTKLPYLMDGLFSWLFQSDIHIFSQEYYLVFGDTSYEVGRPIGINSYFAMFGPGLFSAYGTFMLRQFFMGLPKELEDAAKIDGCGLYKTYTNIILPLSKPALATLTIFTFMGVWRNFMWPLICAQSKQLQPLAVLLYEFMGEEETHFNILMAAALLNLSPIIAVFICGQRYFVAGIRLGALAGQ